MLRVELSAIQNRDIDVFYSAMGTATDGEDYLLIEGGLELAGSVTIPAGEAWVIFLSFLWLLLPWRPRSGWSFLWKAQLIMSLRNPKA